MRSVVPIRERDESSWFNRLTPWNWFEDENRGLRRRRDYSPTARLHDEIDRMFSDFFGRTSDFAEEVASTGEGALMRPTIDVAETDEGYEITCEVPGVAKDDLNVEVVNRTLVIEGEKKLRNEEDKNRYHRIESSYGRFRRLLTLPRDSDLDSIKARFQDGVLTVTFERNEEEAPDRRKIELS